MKIILPIQAKTQVEAIRQMKQAAKHADMAELWLDHIEDLEFVELFTKKPLPVIAVCKRPSEGGLFKGSDEALAEQLMLAIKKGADYIDLPFDIPEKLSKKIAQYALSRDVKTILSHHDFKKMPDFPELLKLANQMIKRKPTIIKIACMARTFQNTLNMIGLAKTLERRIPHILIAMGEKGRLSRVLTPTLSNAEEGGGMMFAILSKNRQTAPGQLTVKELRKAWSLLSFRP